MDAATAMTKAADLKVDRPYGIQILLFNDCNVVIHKGEKIAVTLLLLLGIRELFDFLDNIFPEALADFMDCGSPGKLPCVIEISFHADVEQRADGKLPYPAEVRIHCGIRKASQKERQKYGGHCRKGVGHQKDGNGPFVLQIKAFHCVSSPFPETGSHSSQYRELLSSSFPSSQYQWITPISGASRSV